MPDPLDRFRDLIEDGDDAYPGKRTPINRGAPQKKTPVLHDDMEPWDTRPCYYQVNGVRKEFFRIGDLARACGVAANTVRGWEMRLGFPKPTVRTQRPVGPQAQGKQVGQRLYSRAQVEMVVEAYKRFRCAERAPRSDWKGFIHHVRSNWSAH
jgi:hypothetical protein